MEGTDSQLRARLNNLAEEDLEYYLMSCPVLWSPEHAPDTTEDAFAYLGRFDRLRVGDREVNYKFNPYEGFKPIPFQDLQELDDSFDFGNWGWHRTKMVVNEGDVFDLFGPEIFQKHDEDTQQPENTSLFDIGSKRHEKLVCVMMPFTLKELEPVFAKIDRELGRKGVHCERADTNLSARRIIDKVATLIYHSDAVVCDFTGTNPNVLYETGLAHAWSKQTILIAERGTPIPFDTSAESTIFYDNTDLGLKELWYQISDRLDAQTDLFPSE